MNKEREYIELGIPLNGFDHDLLSAVLAQAAPAGIYEVDAEHWIVYFPADWPASAREALVASLQSINDRFDARLITVDRKPFEDWNAEWKAHFRPLEVVPGCWIRPPWESLPQDAHGNDLIIDPQMAFGTGHHETTRLMIEVVSELDVSGKKLLDLGSGSGILAIYARQRGCSSVLGIDTDPEAIDNACHNRQLNGCPEVEFRIGDITAAGKDRYHIILANIHFEVLRELPGALAERLLPGGTLILSGLLLTDLERIKPIYREGGFTLLAEKSLKEWAALVFQLSGEAS